MIVLIVLIFIIVSYKFSNKNHRNLTRGDIIKLYFNLVDFILLFDKSDIENGPIELFQILILGSYNSKLNVPKIVN